MSTPQRPRRRLFLVISGLAVLYLAVRASLLWRFPAYYDEGFYGVTALRALWHPEARFNALIDNKGPLLTWLSMIPLQVNDNNPLTAVRMVAAAAGVMTMVFIGLTIDRTLGRVWALAGVALFVVLPFSVVHLSMGVHEPLVMALAAAALYLQIRLAQELRLDLSLLLGLVFAAGMLTKSSGLFAVLLLPASLLVFDWEAPARRRRLLRWAGLAVLALTFVLLAEALVRMSPDFYREEADITATVQYNSPSYALHHLGQIVSQNWPSFRAGLVGYLTVPGVVLAAIGIAAGLATRWRLALLVVLWAALPIAVSTVIANKPLMRYYLPALPPLIYLIVAGLAASTAVFVQYARRTRHGPALGVAVCVLIAAPVAWFDGRVLADPMKAQLPAFDDRELIADAASGTYWPELGGELRSHLGTVPGQVTVSGIRTELLAFYAGGDNPETLLQLKPEDPGSDQSPVLIQNGGPAPDPSRWRQIWTVTRVRDGVPMTLWERIG